MIHIYSNALMFFVCVHKTTLISDQYCFINRYLYPNFIIFTASLYVHALKLIPDCYNAHYRLSDLRDY